jgi:hypothetical protein
MATPRLVHLPEKIDLNQIEDLGDKMNIIKLWEDFYNNKTKLKTRVCGRFDYCVEHICIFSHCTIMGIPITRCNACLNYDCGKDHIKRFTLKLKGEISVHYVVCRRVAWELEDEFIRSNRYNSDLEKLLAAAKIKAAINEPGIVEEKQQDDQLANKRPRNEDLFYDLEVTSSNKRALIHLIEDESFNGSIKIDSSYLRNGILKLSDTDIISLKTELQAMPNTAFFIDRAETRIQLDLLRMKVQSSNGSNLKE